MELNLERGITLKTIRRIPLQLEIIEAIKDYIKENNLRNGDKLPSQAQMIGMLGVSMSSLREALKMLEAKGVLEFINGKGIYVKDETPNVISTQVEFKNEKESILELLEARKSLEREIINLIIQNASNEELSKAGKILDIIMGKYRDNQKQNLEDREFHFALYKCCHNRVMYELIESVDNLLEKLWQFPFGLKDPFTDTIPLHEKLYENIINRNVKEAQNINDKILEMICETIRRSV